MARRSSSFRVLFAGLLVAAAGSAQTTAPPTAAPSPQTPAHRVAEALPPARAAALAAQLDRLLAAGLSRRGAVPTPIVDDATFVRRAYLQAIGRIPDLTEVESFLADADPNKRSALVDRLLDSPGYTSNEANYWFDLLRVKSRQRQFSGEPFAHWIKESIRQGMPYDEFVAAMVTASGPAQQEGNGATGFLLRDMNMPHDAMANTLRLFTGTRLECAQCHNHPFDKWTQREFYAMAAFYGGLRYRVDVDRQLTQQLRAAANDGDERQKQAARRLLQTLATGIAGDGSGQERLPADYKYDDAAPRALVHAATLFGAEARLPTPKSPTTAAPRARARAQRQEAPDVDSRQAFAAWLTDPKNPRFTRVIVNRTWQRLFGRGLCDPVDDLKDDTQAVHPELERQLERLLVDLRYDLRQLQRVLMLTRLFQQEVVADDPAADQPFAFHGPLLRRMTAEQLWDSLLTLQIDEVDQRLLPTDARVRELYARQQQLASGATDVKELLASQDPQRLREQARARAQQEQATAADPAAQQRQRELLRAMALARRNGDAAATAKLREQLAALVGQRPGSTRNRNDLLRASELQQPAPESHFLRQFGQSDRETIDGAATVATVPQALTLLNGPLTNGDSALRTRLLQADSHRRQVELAFLAVLSRSPSAGETECWLDELAADEAKALQDLVWVLCNSNEFRFRR